jgi:hypothetical protein
MKLSSIIQEYYEAFSEKYGDSILPGQWKALNALLNCRPEDAGQLSEQTPAGPVFYGDFYPAI